MRRLDMSQMSVSKTANMENVFSFAELKEICRREGHLRDGEYVILSVNMPDWATIEATLDFRSKEGIHIAFVDLHYMYGSNHNPYPARLDTDRFIRDLHRVFPELDITIPPNITLGTE